MYSRLVRTTGFAIGCFLVVCGCGDSPPSPRDAGVDAGGDAARPPADVAPPAEPALPVLTPCPPGWVERERAGVVVCAPYAGGGPSACASNELHVPGEPSCARIGTACPGDGVPEGLPADVAVLYVRAGAAGDGSLASPFGSIGEALAAAPDGAIVAIAPGTYDELLRIGSAVTLWGACPEGVVLTTSEPAPLDVSALSGTITVDAGSVTVRNLKISGAARPGIWAAVAGTSVELLDVIVEGATAIGIEIENGAHLRATGLIVRDTSGGPTRQLGRGLGVELGAVAEVRRALFERNPEFGIGVIGPSGSIVLEDVVLRDNLPRESNQRDGPGLAVLRGGSARLSRAWVERNRASGVSGIDPGSTVEIEDTWIVDTLPQVLDGWFGRGLSSETGATVTARRVIVTGSHESGAIAAGADAHLTIEDAVIDESLPRESDGWFGRGVGAQLGASLTLARVRIDRSVEAGVWVAGTGSTAALDDVLVRATAPGVDGFTRSVAVADGAHAVANRLRVDGSRGVGVLVARRATFELTDGLVTATRDSELDIPARGVSVQERAIATFARVRIEDSDQYGLLALTEDSVVEATDLAVVDTHARACPTRDCHPGGTAVGVFGGASLRADGFILRSAELCGVHVGAGANVDLARGAVSGCLVGACVQSEGYDLGRLSNDVRYADNGLNLDAETLPVPDVVPKAPHE